MISVVVPAYDEERAIVETIERIQKSLSGSSHEVIVVDDGSLDGTASLAEKAGAKVLRHPHNIGYGRSLKDGIAAAKNDTIVITDSDGTYPIEKIPELLAEYKKGFDMVVGARTGPHYRESATKSLLRLILKILVEFTTGRQIPDINSGLRVFSKKEITPYFSQLCETFSFTTSLTIAYMMTGKFVAYKPIPYDKRNGDSKVWLLRDSLRTLQFIVQVILHYNPIKLFLVLSGFTLFLSAVCFVSFALTNLQGRLFIGLIGVFASVIVFAIGLLADLLRQIHLKTD